MGRVNEDPGNRKARRRARATARRRAPGRDRNRRFGLDAVAAAIMSAADRHVAALVWDPDGPVPDDYQDRIAQIEATGEAVERAIFRLFPFDRPPARPIFYARRGNRRARRTARRAARHGA